MARSKMKWKELYSAIIDELRFEEIYNRRLFEQTQDERFMEKSAIYSSMQERFEIIKRKMLEI